MDRADYERIARSLVNLPRAPRDMTEAYIFLAEHDISPEIPDETRTFQQTAEVFGAQRVPMNNAAQREEFAVAHGWSDPEEIAHIAVSEVSGKREIVVLQKMDGDVEVYVTKHDGTGWTIDPVTIRASY